MLTVEKAEGLAAKLDEQAKTITVTFPDGFEEGRLVVMFYDGADNVIIKPLIFTTMEGAPTGIRNADDLKAFASAVNAGKSLAKYTIDGEVCLMNDIDMAGTDWSDYVIGGVVTPSTADANKAVTYAMGENVFNKVFNGKNFALKNVDWTFDLADGQRRPRSLLGPRRRRRNQEPHHRRRHPSDGRGSAGCGDRRFRRLCRRQNHLLHQ